MPPSRGVRLIAIDIDGTLLDSRGTLPETNRVAVRAALDAGIHVALATGRSFHHARPIGEALSPEIPLIVSNGALVKRADGQTLDRRVLDPTLVRDLIGLVREHAPGAALIFDRPGADQYVYEGIDWQHPNRRAYFEINKVFMTEQTPLEDALTDSPIQLAFTGSVGGMRQLAEFLRRQPVARRVTLTLTEYEDRDFTLLDIIALGCSKGSTLAAWASTLEIDRADVMAIGDNLNDSEMLEFAGHPVVMGNAVAELKNQGWPETTGHDDGGVADAIGSAIAGLTD